MPALNPFRAYDLYNPEEARQTGMSEHELSKWFAQVLALDNPVMREFNVMALLLGLRRSDVLMMKWEHVHDSHIVIPKPKGKIPSKVPLTASMRRSLERVRRAGKVLCDISKCHDWVFPSTISASGHLEEPKSKHLDHSPHALRHSFRGFCAGAKISTVHSKLLMLHKISKDVHDSYMTEAAMFDQLQEASAALSAYVFKKLPKGAEKQLERRLRDQLIAH